MAESLKDLVFFGNKKAKIPKLDENPKIFGKKTSVGDTVFIVHQWPRGPRWTIWERDS